MVSGEMILQCAGVNDGKARWDVQFSPPVNEEIGRGDRSIKMLFASEKILLASND